MKSKKWFLLIIIALLLLTTLYFLVPRISYVYSEYRQSERDKEHREKLIGVWKEDIPLFDDLNENIFALLPEENDYWNGYLVDYNFKLEKLHWDINNNELTIDINKLSKTKYKILYISEKEMVIGDNAFKDKIKIMSRTGQRNFDGKDTENKPRLRVRI